MYTLRVENQKGGTITLTQNESRYQVVSVDGLNPPKANIYTSAIANLDGAKYKNSKLDMRNIVITVRLQGDVEENRLYLYRYFKIGKWCKITYKNGMRSVYIEGYCETIECNLFTDKEEAQISIICPKPYFKALDGMLFDISKTIGSFEFPFAFGSNGATFDDNNDTDDAIEFSYIERNKVVSVRNVGEIETGVIIHMAATADNVTNPMVYNTVTNEYFKINDTLNEGDEIIICTNRGEKSVTKISDGIRSNAMHLIATGSTWFILDIGDNLFSYDSDTNDEYLNIVFKVEALYEGV